MKAHVRPPAEPQDARSYFRTDMMSRRRLVTAMGGLAAAAATLPVGRASAAEPTDPIFALIEAHRMARARYDGVRDAAEALFQNLPDDVQADAGLITVNAAEKEADDAEAAAIDALCSVPATTIAGTLALVRYMLAYDRKYLDSRIDEAHPGYRIAFAVERLLGLLSA